MRKHVVSSVFAGALALALSNAASFGAISTPHVAGDFQGWDAAANPMTETFAGSGIWTETFTGLGANTRHEWKVTDGTWGTSFPGVNSWLYSDGSGNVTITYDSNVYADGWSSSTDRLGLSTDPGTWTAVGSWQSQIGGSDWDNANPNTVMNSIGGGIYELSAVLAPGNYDWKAVVSGSWDSISSDTRSVNTANWNFTTDAVNNNVIFRVDALTGTAQLVVQAVPEPSAIALAGIGLAGLLIVSRRKG